jgi:hypothetical protein
MMSNAATTRKTYGIKKTSGFAEKVGTAVSTEAYSNIASSKLPHVLLKTHVKMTAIAVVPITNSTKGMLVPTKPVPAPLNPGTRNRGRCQMPQSTPSTRVPSSGPERCCAEEYHLEKQILYRKYFLFIEIVDEII